MRGKAGFAGLLAIVAACSSYGSGDDEKPPAAPAPAASTCACAQLPPVGWEGPFALSRGASAATCTGDFGVEAFLGRDRATAPKVQCEKCACGAPQLSCLVQEVNSSSTGCYDNCGIPAAEQGPNASCMYVPAAGSCTFSTAAAFHFEAKGDYSCPASGGERRLTTTNADPLRLCRQSVTLASTCTAAESCSAPLPSGFTARCIVSSEPGDVACPTGAYSQKIATFQSMNDANVSCSACSCVTKPGVCSTGLTTYADDKCATDPKPLAILACTPAGATARYAKYDPTPSATCEPRGGEPIGEATFDGLRTLCCMP